jgi:hypothetical protein
MPPSDHLDVSQFSSQFSSLDDAMDKVQLGDRYLEVGRRLMAVSTEFETSYTSMFWFSVLARSRALHGDRARDPQRESDRRLPADPGIH